MIFIDLNQIMEPSTCLVTRCNGPQLEAFRALHKDLEDHITVARSVIRIVNKDPELCHDHYSTIDKTVSALNSIVASVKYTYRDKYVPIECRVAFNQAPLYISVLSAFRTYYS